MKRFRKKIHKMSMFIFIIGFVAWGCWFIDPEIKFIKWLSTLVNISNNWCEKPELNDNISCGEESLFTQHKYSYFQSGKFQKAVNSFTRERNKNRNNPEILIYLNNAKLMQKRRKSYTIAVAVPINREGRDIAEASLRGVAQVQEEFNKNPNNLGLKIVIFNDENNPQTVYKLTQRLLAKNDLVAVVGHYSSEVHQAALPVYQNQQIVVISGGVSAMREAILDPKKDPNNFFFRTVPDVHIQIRFLIKQLQSFQLANGAKVAIFYTPNSTYSQSAFTEFNKQLGAEKIIDRDISSSNFYAESILNEVKQQGAKALIFIPDGRINNSSSFDNTISLIDANADKLPMLGFRTLYSRKIFDKKNFVKNLFLVVPWHYLKSEKKFIKSVNDIWKTDQIDSITALSYDATLVLTKALENLSISDSLKKQRLDIQEQLKTLQVQEGASGIISFDQNGDRKEDTSQIVHVVPTICNIYRARFVPINYDLKTLNCLSNKTGL